MRIGLQGAFGRAQITIDDSATVGELTEEIKEASSLPDFDLKGGFPIKPINLVQFDASTKLSDTGLELNGQRLQVEARNLQAQLSQPLANSTPTNQAPAPVKSVTAPAEPMSSRASTRSQGSAAPLALKKKQNDVEKDPPALPIRNGDSYLIHRVMPDDNSCLFRAIGKCVLGNALDGMTELRSIVAQTIQADPSRYTAVVLEKEPDDYCRWIQTDDAWGGAIEIGIIAEVFNVEVYAINVDDNSIQKFNEGQQERIYLVYSGIHWDCIVENIVGKDGPLDFDVCQFKAYDDEVLVKAQQIGEILNKGGYYTDTRKFGIMCNDCQWKGTGEQAATAHYSETGHHDFGQVA